jgi:glyoxalase family protein
VGQVTRTSFSVPTASLGFWATRLRNRHIGFLDEETAAGEESIVFEDPSGLVLRLVGDDRDVRTPWATSEVRAKHAVRGLHSVTLMLRSKQRTLALLTELLSFTAVNESETGVRLAVNGDLPGHYMEIAEYGEAEPAMNGTGAVHHVAMAISDAELQLALRAELLRQGYRVTEVRDRQYFQSIYFREPGGVLFEVATVRPGFTVDEPLDALGRQLKLPPWEEPHRASIEAALPAIMCPEEATTGR